MTLEERKGPPFCCVTGIERSGTIWHTRLLADAFGLPGGTRSWRWDNPELDGAVHALDRDGPSVRRGHWYPNAYPYRGSPVVVTCRDPRDVAVSHSHYYNKPDLRAVALWLAPRWAKFLAEWEKEGVPFSRYEDMLADPSRQLRKVIAGLGLEMPSDEAIAEAVVTNEFKVMVAEGRKHKEMRKGTAGQWREVMAPETAEAVARAIGPELARWGY